MRSAAMLFIDVADGFVFAIVVTSYSFYTFDTSLTFRVAAATAVSLDATPPDVVTYALMLSRLCCLMLTLHAA